MRYRLFIDLQHQSINCYQLISISIDFIDLTLWLGNKAQESRASCANLGAGTSASALP